MGDVPMVDVQKPEYPLEVMILVRSRRIHRCDAWNMGVREGAGQDLPLGGPQR